MTRRIYSLALCLLLCGVSAFAQSDQQVQVKEYNGKNGKTALAQVGITVTNAGATMSDAQGNAVLHFRTLRAGDKAVVRRIEKAGYEVFNQQALDQWIISTSQPFVVVLCRSDRMKQLRDNYMRVSSASYERQYKKDQAKLAAERQAGKLKEEEYQQQLQQLQDEYDEQLENLENYVDQFARIDLSEITSQEQEVISLIEAGEMEKAVELYEKYDFKGQYEQQTRDIQKIDAAAQRLQEEEARQRDERAQVQQMISRQIATYRLAGGRENFAKITALLKGVADADTTNVDAVYDYAYHAYSQGEYEECLTYFGMAYRNTDNADVRCEILRGMNFCYEGMREYEKGEQAMLQIYELRKALYDSNAERFLPLVAQARMDLGVLYMNAGDVEQAAAWLTPALADYEQLAQRDEELYWDGICTTLGYNALLRFYSEEAELADQLFTRAYELAKRHVVEGDDRSAQKLLEILTFKEQFCYMTEDWTGNLPYMQEDVALHEKLYQHNPERHALTLAASLSNLAEVYLNLGQLEQSEETFLRAWAMYEQLLAKHPNRYATERFAACDVGAKLYRTLDQPEKMRQFIQLAKACFEKMPQADREAYQPFMDGMAEME